MNEPFSFALQYAARGWRVGPCWWSVGSRCACSNPGCQSPGKHPIGRLVPHGLNDATVDPVLIAAWWRQYPKANVAIRTGIESGLIVVDVDTYKGGDVSLEELEAKHGRLPYSFRVRTGSGGLHVFFRHPGGRRIASNTSGKLGPGIDLKADGGYVIAPPSLHVSGRRYTWLDEDSSTLEDAPEWLLGLLSRYDERPPVDPAVIVAELPEEYAVLVVEDVLPDAFLKVEDGMARHDAGVWLAQQLRDNRVPLAVAAGAMDRFERFANERPGLRVLSGDELQRGLDWAYSRAPRDPNPMVKKVLQKLGLDRESA